MDSISPTVDSKKVQRSWSDLAPDLLSLIIDKLEYIDRIRFRAVCSSWRSINGFKPASKLPWMMGYAWFKNDDVNAVSLMCQLYDPSNKKKYFVTRNITGQKSGDYGGAKICASKDCWVLFCNKIRCPFLFFYSPFSKKIIDAALLYIPGSSFRAATFSSSPDSSDCLVYALCTRDNNLRLYLISPGDKRQRMYQYNASNFSYVKNLLLVDGTLYWIIGQSLAFINLSTQMLNVVMLPRFFNYFCYHLIEYDGCLLVAHNIDSILNNNLWVIDLYDPQRRIWSWFDNDRLLFVGSTTMSIPAEGEASHLAATAHDDILCRSYRLKQTVHFHSPALYDGMQNNWLKKIWIQPPRL